MMITLRPVSVTSLEHPPTSHITSVGPDGEWGIVVPNVEHSPPRGHRKRLKSTGDCGRISASPPGLSRDSTKKSLLSVFGIKTKNKAAKTRSSEMMTSNGITSIDFENPDIEPMPVFNFARTLSCDEEGRHGKITDPTAVQAKTDSNQAKALQHSVSLTTSAKKDNAFFQPGDDYDDFPCKFERPPTPVKPNPVKIQQQTIENARKSSIGDVLQALSGPPLDNKPEDGPATGSTNDDRSPLIDRLPTTEKLVAIAATSFDNIASVTELDHHHHHQQHHPLHQTISIGAVSGGSGNTSPSALTTSTSSSAVNAPSTGNGTSMPSEKIAASGHGTSWWNISKNAVNMSSSKPPLFGTLSSNSGSSSGGGSVVGTLKKRKPRLNLSLTSSSKDTGGMRQMSASEDRKIDEAMQLASQLARLCTNEHAMLPSSPRSISGSSKESLESPALASSASSSFFFPGFRRRPPAEKKTFADGLQASLSIDVAEKMFTPDAQAAYNQLVASSPPASGSDSVTSKAPSSRRHESRSHRLQLLEAPVLRHHQRSFFSESDQELITNVALPLAFQTNNGRPPPAKRSTSLSDDAPTFHIQMTKNFGASDSTLSPSTSVVSASDDRTPRAAGESVELSVSAESKSESVPEQRAPSPPPLLPPRVPLRPSTVNARPRQRKHPLISTSPSNAATSPNSLTMPNKIVRQHRQTFPADKPRFASEALPSRAVLSNSLRRADTKVSKPISSASIDVVLPRRATRSAADVEEVPERRSVVSWRHPSSSSSICSDDIDSGRRHQLLNVTQESSSSDDSSVFAAEHADSDNDPPPLSPAPLPPRELVGGFREPEIAHPRDVLRTKTRHNARDLGFDDARDAFWTNQVDFRLMNRGMPSNMVALSQSEEDLLEELVARPTLGLYDTSDAVSYEDLMEFALDGPQRRKPLDESECDEVRLMRKLLSKDVTVDECVDALADTRWDVYSAIKLVKLNQLLTTGLADKQRSKEALLSCGWNVEEAVNYLLSSSNNSQSPR